MTSESFIVNLAKRGAGLKPDIAVRPRQMLYSVPEIFGEYPAGLEPVLASTRRAMRKGRMVEADAPLHAIEKAEVLGRDLQSQPFGSSGLSQGGSGGAMPLEWENKKETTRGEVPGLTAKADERLKKIPSPPPDKVVQDISVPGTGERGEPSAGILEEHPFGEAKSESEFPSQEWSALEAAVQTACEPGEAAPSLGIKTLHSSIHKARGDLEHSGPLSQRHLGPMPSGSGLERHPLKKAHEEKDPASINASGDEAAPSSGIKPLHSSIHKARGDPQLSGPLLQRHVGPMLSVSGLERHPLKKAHEEKDQVSLRILGSEKQEAAEEVVSEPMVIETASQASYNLDKENPSVESALSRIPVLPRKDDGAFNQSESRGVNVRIGTIEVHADISPEPGASSKPRSYGFDEYVMIRSYLSDEL